MATKKTEVAKKIEPVKSAPVIAHQQCVKFGHNAVSLLSAGKDAVDLFRARKADSASYAVQYTITSSDMPFTVRVAGVELRGWLDLVAVTEGHDVLERTYRCRVVFMRDDDAFQGLGPIYVFTVDAARKAHLGGSNKRVYDTRASYDADELVKQVNAQLMHAVALQMEISKP